MSSVCVRAFKLLDRIAALAIDFVVVVIYLFFAFFVADAE